jgi:hypothetical protein
MGNKIHTLYVRLVFSFAFQSLRTIILMDLAIFYSFRITMACYPFDFILHILHTDCFIDFLS